MAALALWVWANCTHRRACRRRRTAVLSGKYSKDYSLHEELDSHGRLRTVADYVGDYYRYVLPRDRRGLPLVTALVALCAASLLVPLLAVAPILRAWYVMIPLALAIAPAVLLVQWCVRLLTLGEKLTHQRRDQIDRLAPWSFLAALLAAVSLAGQIVYAATGQGPLHLPTLCATAALLGSGAALFALRRRFDMEPIPAETTE